MAFANWQNASSFSFSQRHTTHDYTASEHGVDYAFEAIAPDSAKASMTGQKKGIKPGHIIVLRQNSNDVRYQVEHIDYYANPADMWTAQLIKIN
jgi:hypothetical protein